MTKVIYAVADMHGRVDLLRAIRKIIAADAKKHGFTEKKIVYLGDYIDRGPNSKEVLDTLINKPMEGFTEVHLKGNHEDMMYNAVKRKYTVREMDVWLYNGGYETLLSYGIDTKRNDPWNKIPQEHIDWIGSLPTMHIDGGYVFVHAGIEPEIPLEQQRDEVLMWVRGKFLNYTGIHKNHLGQPFTVVHGHTPAKEPEHLINRINLDTWSCYNGVQYAIALHNGNERLLKTPQFEKIS